MSRYDKYLGLEHRPGLQDCYSVIRNYLRDEFGMILPNFARPNNFWEDQNLDLYQMYRRFGFQPVFDEPHRLNDILVMPYGTVMNTHAALVVEGNQILHHPPGGLSTLDPLFPKWASRANIVVRHPRITKLMNERKERVQLHEVVDADIFRNPRVQQILERAMGSDQ